MITVSIDGIEISVPAGTLVIRAAELLGIEIPRFCDHPLLEPAGACRQCLVEVGGRAGPVTACTTVLSENMVVRTQLSSPMAADAQRDVMELLLINHPLDCPVCDKGGECPLQNQSMSAGRSESRFDSRKRTFPKPIALSSQVLLDRERCVQCARCTRFADQIAGDPALGLMERGAAQQVGVNSRRPFDSYFSGNTVQICPVGALTAVAYRFRSRPFGLVSTPSVCEHCASGCALRIDWRNGKVMRRMAGDDPCVNEEWNCDKGRWAFHYATEGDRLNHPRIRDDRTGEQTAASWPAALHAVGRGLAGAHGRAAVLTGGRLTLEDAYAYAKFARVALGTNDVDFRARPLPAEEGGFLEAWVAGRELGPTYEQLERAPIVLIAGLEPEEESPIVFLRLRKGARRGVAVFSIAPFTTPGLRRVYGELLPARPGAEAHVLTALAEDVPAPHGALTETARLLRRPGAVILVGERLAAVPGGLSAAARLAERTGAALGWVPRRAGDRTALEAGAFPSLLPGGRPVADERARNEVAALWDVPALPGSPGRDTEGILTAAADGLLDALVIGGVEIDDLRDPETAIRAIERVPFVVNLELRRSAVSERADVVFPVAAIAEKQGTFVNWEGRRRPFDAVLRDTRSMPDRRVLNAVAAEMGVDLGLPSVTAARRELAALDTWSGERPVLSAVAPPPLPPRPHNGEAVLSTWRMLLDKGRMQDGEERLAAAARRPVARLCPATAREIGAAEGDPISVGTDRGVVTLPLVLTEMPERVVWVPANVHGRAVHRELGAIAGAFVRVGRAVPPAEVGGP